MRRSLTVFLTARRPRRRLRAVVRSLTLRRFTELFERANEAVVRATVAKPGTVPITLDEFLAALTCDDWTLFAELACPDQPPGFFLPFLDEPQNTVRLIDAVFATNDWERIKPGLNLRQRRTRPGSLESDLIILCRAFPGLTPPAIYDGWYMDDFVRTCDGLIAVAGARPGQPDLDAPICADSDLASIPGVGLVS